MGLLLVRLEQAKKEKNMSFLSTSARCKLFEDIAEKVWKRISLAHEVNVNLSEIGITSDIMVEILQYNKGLTNFDVYVKKADNEKLYGNDIDVFVETNINEYRWFALQAKILKTSGQYDKLRYPSGGSLQWDKLLLLEGVSGCESYYLLYNGDGKNTYNYTGTDECGRTFSESQFGCSLVKTSDVRRIASRTNTKGQFIKASFNTFHHVLAEPWRILTCCYHQTAGKELYTLEEIKESTFNFKLITTIIDDEENEEAEEDENENEKDEINNVNLNIDNPISKASQEAKWNPGLRLVIHRTDNLE
jgi:hypothetical protein